MSPMAVLTRAGGPADASERIGTYLFGVNRPATEIVDRAAAHAMVGFSVRTSGLQPHQAWEAI
jgi:hypothetical protein